MEGGGTSARGIATNVWIRERDEGARREEVLSLLPPRARKFVSWGV